MLSTLLKCFINIEKMLNLRKYTLIQKIRHIQKNQIRSVINKAKRVLFFVHKKNQNGIEFMKLLQSDTKMI